MPDLIPTDSDPFSANLVPVNYNPFGDGPTPKPGQTIAPQNIQADIGTLPQEVAGDVSGALGITDAMKALRGQMTPEEAQTFALGALPMLIAPEAKGVSELAEEGVPPLSKMISAFHASPYDFNKFDLSKIGTGEGAQAYGHGLYFAENPATADMYAKNFDARSGSEQDATRYQVSINANLEHFLDWDKPLSEQSPQVRDAVLTLAKHPYDDPATWHAQQAYDWIAATHGDPNAPLGERPAIASEALRQAGVPGIKYLDRGSRGPGEGTHNYVVFNDDLINIVKKYGVAGLIGGGAAHFSTTPVDYDPFSQ